MSQSFVHKVILSLLPDSAGTFSGGGLEGCVWIRGAFFAYIAFEADGTPLCGRMREAVVRDGVVDAGFERRPAHRLDVGALLRGDPLPPAMRSRDPGVLSVVARFAGAIDCGAVEAMIARGIDPTAQAYALVAGARGFAGQGDRIGLCRRYPWAASVLAEANSIDPSAILGWTDADDLVAGACVAAAGRDGMSLDHGRVRGLVEAIGGTALPPYLASEMPRLLGALSYLPAGPIFLDGAKAEDAKALLCLLYLSRCYAAATGIPLGRIVPSCGRDWLKALENLVERAGLTWLEGDAEDVDDGPRHVDIGDDDVFPDAGEIPLPCETTETVLHAVNDFVAAFEAQVVVPALVEARPELADGLAVRRPRSWHWFAGQPWIEGDPEALAATPAGIALRLLARDKSLAGFLDEVRDWHANQAEIAGLAAGVAGHVSWPAAFADWQAPNGLTISCLTTAAQLGAEGVAMRNCVASYVDKCRTARCIIAAIRDAEGSVATLELVSNDGVPYVHQIAGLSNAPASQRSREAADGLIQAIATRELPMTFGSLAFEAATLDPLTYVGHYEDMRDAWSPHLARGARGLPAADLLSTAGPRRGAPRHARTARATAPRQETRSAG